MGKLIYSLTTSLDGFISDTNGNFDWAAPSEEVHQCVNDNLRNVGTFLFGRGVYEELKVWDTLVSDGESQAMDEFIQIWRAAKKIVYSTSLSDVQTVNTTLEKVFDLEAVQKMMSESNRDLNIGGPHLAAQAIKAGVIDEYHQYIVPTILGDGTHWLPHNVKVELELITLQKFDNGTVHLQYNKV